MAALECFNRHGIEATSIGEIGERAGASIGSMYHHFSSKEGIGIALLVEGLHSHSLQLEQRLRRARTARQGVKALVHSLVDWVAANPEWARFVYTVSSSSLMQAGREPLQRVNAHHARVLDDFFAPHIAAGAFRRLPRECLPSLILGPVHDYARRWLSGQVRGRITTHAGLFADEAWNTVRRP